MGRRLSDRTRQEGISASPPIPCLPRGRGRWRHVPPSAATSRTPALRAPVSPQRHPAPPQVEPGRSQERPRLQLVYVNSFGSHRCGSIIRYGGGFGQAEAGRAGPPLPQAGPAGEAGRQRAALMPGDEASPGVPATRDGAEAVGSCGIVKPVKHHHGDLRKAKADTFDFPFPSRNVDNVIKRKKRKSKVWPKVWKVVSKMLEENEEFRNRLLTCRQFNGEGNDTNQSSQNEASYLDSDGSIFGWV